MWGAPNHLVICEVSRLTTAPNGILLSAFPAALRRCGGWPEASLHLAGPGPSLARMLARVGMGRYLPIHESAAAGVIASHADAIHESHTLDFEPDPHTLQMVRATTNAVWPGHHSAGLVADELAANAIKHAGGAFSLALARSVRGALIAVTDSAIAEPVVRNRLELSEHGHGMHIVGSLSEDWGVRLVHPRGKTVWALLAAG